MDFRDTKSWEKNKGIRHLAWHTAKYDNTSHPRLPNPLLFSDEMHSPDNGRRGLTTSERIKTCIVITFIGTSAVFLA